MEKKSLKLCAVGMSYKTSDISDRELYEISRKDLPESLKYLVQLEAVEGVIGITTCNRLEFYITCEKDADHFNLVKKFYQEFKQIDTINMGNLFYSYENGDVTKHLFRVICGLDSLVLGEYQIQGQVKEGYSIACKAETVDKVLHKLFHAAFRAGKKVRTKTRLGEGKQSVSGVASKLMTENLEKDKTVAIIGVNENSKIMATKLQTHGFHNFIFVNRTKYKADIMAEDFGGSSASLSDLEKVLFEADAVFTSTGAKGSIIGKEMLQRLLVQERCPQLLVDMAIPRDIDSSVLPKNIKYYDMDKLQKFLDDEKVGQKKAVKEAEKILKDEYKLFQAWSEHQNENILEQYAEGFEITRQRLIDEYRTQFSEQQFEKVEKLTRSLVHRLQSNFIRVLINEKTDN
jgi:glutamyl-tRNA reductase